MSRRLSLSLLASLTLAIPVTAGWIVAPAAAGSTKADSALTGAIAAPHRSETNRARDANRHPLETLQFFGIKPRMTVVEIWPGGGWYTEILAPYLAAKGHLIAASPPGRGSTGIEKLIEGNPTLYAKLARANFPAILGGTPVKAGSADMVLTFRNVHNWRMGSGLADNPDYSADAFKEMFAMLKPGGTLGVVDHRLPENADAERERSSGYIKVSTIRKLAEQAGFEFVAESEINANPKDTTDYANGVWTLPPVFRLGDQDRAKYAAIGESDRMTLKFRKPRK